MIFFFEIIIFNNPTELEIIKKKNKVYIKIKFLN